MIRYTDEQIEQMREARVARDAVYDLHEEYSWEVLACEMICRMTGDQARSFLSWMQNFPDERYMRED
jgi:hypothetical protein